MTKESETVTTVYTTLTGPLAQQVLKIAELPIYTHASTGPESDITVATAQQTVSLMWVWPNSGFECGVQKNNWVLGVCHFEKGGKMFSHPSKLCPRSVRPHI